MGITVVLKGLEIGEGSELVTDRTALSLSQFKRQMQENLLAERVAPNWNAVQRVKRKTKM